MAAPSIKKYLPYIAGATGVAAALIATSLYGAGLSPDAVGYISVARSLLEGNGYRLYNGIPYTAWPPLFPTLLAGFGVAGVEPAVAARYVNACAFGGIIVIAGLWLNRYVRALPFILLGLAAVTFSVPLLSVAAYAGTEPLFILFALGSLTLTDKHLECGSRRYLYLAAALAALACLTRYIGVTVVLAGVVSLLLRKGYRLRDRLWDALRFGAVAGLPIVLWSIRNYLLFSEPAGRRAPAAYTLWQNIYFTLTTIRDWFFPGTVLLIVALTAVVLMAVLAVRAVKYPGTATKNVGETPAIFLFLPIYLCWLIVSATFVAFDGIDSRLLSPVYVPLVLLCVMVLAVSGTKASVNKTPVYAALLLLSILVLNQWGNFVFTVTYRAREGAGELASRHWRESGLVRLMQKPLPGRVYSNVPEALYMLDGVRAQYTPCRYEYNSPGTKTNDLNDFKKEVASGGVSYVVWFSMVGRDYMYPVEELAGFIPLEKVAEAADGAVYVSKPGSSR